MVVDHGSGNAGRTRDGLDRDAAVAQLQDHGQRRIEQLLTALLGRHARRVAPTGPGRRVRWCLGRTRHRARRLADRGPDKTIRMRDVASFTLRAAVAAPIETVFDVLTDHQNYSRLTPLRSSTLERRGAPEPNGVGAIRVLRLAGPPIREEVTSFQRPTRFAYRMLSGAPVKDHTGTVELSTRGGHTDLLWRVETTPRIPVPDAVWAAIVKPVINQLLKGVVKESTRKARTGV